MYEYSTLCILRARTHITKYVYVCSIHAFYYYFSMDRVHDTVMYRRISA